MGKKEENFVFVIADLSGCFVRFKSDGGSKIST